MEEPQDMVEGEQDPLDASISDREEAPQLVPKIYSSEAILSRASQFLLETYRKAKEDHEARINRWLEFDKAYQNIRDRKAEDGAANIVDPEPFVVIETLTANLSEAFFSQDPPFKYSAQEQSDDEQAELMTSYRADHLRRIGIRDKFERSLKQSMVYGTCVVKTPWRKEVMMKVVRTKVSSVNPETGKKETKTETKKVPFPKFDDTDWEFVSLFDFLPVGNGATIEDLDGCIHRVCKTYDELKANERKKKNVDGVDLEKGIYVGLESLKPILSDKLNLLEYWGRIPDYVVTGKEEDRYTTFEGTIAGVVCEDSYGKDQLQAQRSLKSGGVSWIDDQDKNYSANSTAIRCQENPFWSGERPFISMPWTPIDNEFYGIGVIQPIKELWDELNDTRNQLVDNKTLMLRQPMLEDVHANVQRNVNLTGKNVRIKCDDINGVKPLMIQNFQAEGWRNVAAIKDDIRRATAAVESLQGVPLGGSTSATEFSAIQQQAGVRIKTKIRSVDELFKKFLDRSYQYDQQFAEFERFVKVLGKKGARFERVAPEDIFGTFDIVTNGVTQIENSAVKTNKLVNILSIVSRIPPGSPLWLVVKEIWKTMGFSEGVADKIFPIANSEKPEDVEYENMALQLGQKIEAVENENHQMHIQIHGASLEAVRRDGLSNGDLELSYKKHIAQHAYYLQAQMASAQQQAIANGEGQPNSPGAQMRQLAQNGGNPVPVRDVGMQSAQADSPVGQVA